MIHLALAFHDATGMYAMHAAATLISVLKNTASGCHIHIVHDGGLAPAARGNLARVAETFGQQIAFYETEPADAKIRAILPPQLGIGSLYRLALPELLACPKVIYLDCDICCNMDIDELWRESLPDSEKLVAWVQNAPAARTGKKHFNSGVMVMRLDLIRKALPSFKNAVLRSIPLVQGPLLFPDQDALNVLMQKLPYQELPEKYNFQLHVGERWLMPPDELSHRILHYCGRKPWCEPHYISAQPYRENYEILQNLLAATRE